MEIRINNEVVDYTLESEKALGEVVDGIREWLAANGFAVTAIRKDRVDLALRSRLEWQDDPLDEITSLEITALHPTDLAIDKLTAAIQYLDLIKQDGDPESPVVADLLRAVDDVSQMIDDALFLEKSGSGTFGSQFSRLAAATGIPDGDISRGHFDEFLTFVSDLMIVLNSRLRELSDPAGELRASVPALKGTLSKTGDISMLLQTGKDAEAIRQLVRLIEMAEKLLRLTGNLGNQGLINLAVLEIDRVAAGAFAGELNGFLRELSQAIETGDTVLVGDLLEYEIAPRLDSLIETLQQSGVL
ncbi:MAG: hypothetical protein JW852_09815 [Spirochaetales bacterium]|nr:hypothetical protein [Spirochaetales bacterium]